MSAAQPPPRPAVSRKAKGWTIAIVVFFVLWLIGKVSGSGNDDNVTAVATGGSQSTGGIDADGPPSNADASYVVTTASPTATQIAWSSTGATSGQFKPNQKVLVVPAALQSVPVKVCWHMDGASNSMETSDGTDDVAMATGTNIPDGGSNLSGDGCADPVVLQSYLEVLPDDNWRVTVTSDAAAKTSSAATVRPRPSATHRKKKHHSIAPSTTASSAPASCYPLTNGGNCYEPGEFCRQSDEGASGVAGDGESIVCKDNNGLRWEPT